MSTVWIAIVALSALGLVFGLLLGFASRGLPWKKILSSTKSMPFFRKASAGNAVIQGVAPMRKR